MSNFFSDLRRGFADEMDVSQDDSREAARRGMQAEGKDDPSMADYTLGANRTFTKAREVIGGPAALTPGHREALDDMSPDSGPKTVPYRMGEAAGTVVSDVAQDRTRSLWWLFNASQAIVNVAQQVLLDKFAPEFRKTDEVRDAKGTIALQGLSNHEEIEENNRRAIAAGGLGDPKKGARLKRGYSLGYSDADQARIDKQRKDKNFVPDFDAPEPRKVLRKRREAALLSDLATGTIGPSGLAINLGMGLMNPFGGTDGYKAIYESQDDPTKSSNIPAEVLTKYILGRTGDLLPWEEFKKVRPDVSKDEYMKYKAFKYDKSTDLNLSDGTLTIPSGVAKYINDGIHGAEIQFLGRSLPINTAVLPTVAALTGTTLGARYGGGPRKLSARGGLIGGYSSMVGGTLLGRLLEDERRRRNTGQDDGNLNN